MKLLLLVLAAQANVLTLDAALATARRAQPAMRQAEAQLDVARARADAARAPLLPQLSSTLVYQRTTGNFAPRPGQVPINLTGRTPTLDTYNFFNFGFSLTQQIYDSQRTIDRWRAARVNVEAARASQRDTLVEVELGVRVAFFQARAQRALVDVAAQTLANQERHLAQVEGFVKAGARPEIDLAQARTDRANARVQLIRAENDYAAAKARLNLAMGVEGPTDYEVADETLPPIDVEERTIDVLFDEARRARPDLVALEHQVAAQELTLRATWGGFGPALSAGMNTTGNGVDIAALAWNWNVNLTLSWNLFDGLNVWSQVKEQRAQLVSLRASLEAARQQVRLDVEQARLAVRAARAAIDAAGEALTAAEERLRLAQGRYAAGVGNAIELGDAQLALSAAAAQRVQADYDLAQARAQLLRALGR